MSRVLALLFAPLVVLVSVHELYLRNQDELHHTVQALFPFWAAGVAATLVGAFLQRHDRLRPARAALWGYYATGFAFMLWGFLRWLPLASGLSLWVLDTVAGSALFAAGAVAATLAAAKGRHPRSVEPALAALALVLAAREATGLVRLNHAPPPSVGDIPKAFSPGGNPRLPNVYHLMLDSFQDELFEPCLPPGAEELFDGFVRFRLVSPMRHTMSVLPWILAGRWVGDARTRLNRTLTGDASLFTDFRRAGYRSLGFVPNFLYRPNPPALDVTVFLDDSVFLDGRDNARVRAMHSSMFRQLWAYSVLPIALSRPLAGDTRAEPGTLRSLRISALAQPVVSRLGMERFLEAEPDLPARGRYTFVHLLLPHPPDVLHSDCSQGGAPTDFKQQTDCTLRLVVHFLETLRRLGRLEDSVVVIHGDHGSGYVLKDGRLVADPSAQLRTILLAKPVGARGPMRAGLRPASIVDIAPTLLALAGIPPGREFDGRVLEDVAP